MMASLKVQRIRDEISTSIVTSNPQISGLFQAPLGLVKRIFVAWDTAILSLRRHSFSSMYEASRLDVTVPPNKHKTNKKEFA